MRFLIPALIFAQLAPVLAQAAPVPSAPVPTADAHALLLSLTEKIVESRLFSGPDGQARFEQALRHAMDAQAARIEKALATQTDAQLERRLTRALKHAKRLGAPNFERRLNDLLSNPATMRAKLEAQLDPALREKFLAQAMARQDCDPYSLDDVEGVIVTVAYLWDALKRSPDIDWVWGVPVIGLIAAVGIPVMFVVDITIGFPVWFFADYLPCRPR
jgi:hypothetical protein